MSFTIFLALNDAGFCNNYLRKSPNPKGACHGSCFAVLGVLVDEQEMRLLIVLNLSNILMCCLNPGFLSLSNYFYFWGWFYVVTTVLLLYKSEKPFHNTHISNSNHGSDTQINNLEPRYDDTYKPVDGIENGAFQGQGIFEDYGIRISSFEEKKTGVTERRKDGFKLTFGHGSLDDRVAGTIRQMGVKRMYRRLWAVVTLPSILTSITSS